MFSLFKKQRPYEDEALRLYAAAMDAARQPVFYQDLDVPDTMDGRFDLLLVHLFFILNRLLENQDQSDDLAQAIFDAAFADFDQALRETGVGDMGITKHMKRMMLAFNGRMHAYSDALKAGQVDLEAALRRNLYGTLDEVSMENLQIMAEYMYKNVEALSLQGEDVLRSGSVQFIDAPEAGA